MATGDFDPADAKQLDQLVYEAVKRFVSGLAALPAGDRAEVVADARAAAVEAALTYEATTARTTKWKTCANAANYAVRRYLADRARTKRSADIIGAEGQSSEARLESAGRLVYDPFADDDSGPQEGERVQASDGHFYDSEDKAWEADVAFDDARERFAKTLRDPADQMIFEYRAWQPKQLAERLGLAPNTVSQKRRRLEQRWEAEKDQWLSRQRALDSHV